MEKRNAEYHHFGLHGVQEKKLFDDKEQANHSGQVGVQEVLPLLP